MEFIYNTAHLPKDQKLLTHINTSAKELYQNLREIDIKSLNISEYNQRYLTDHVKNLHGILLRHTYILAWALANTNTPLCKFVFLEYGGGIGLLALLAKQLNIGTVIYNDIYNVSCKDASVIANHLKIKADHYVHGDLDDVISFVRNKNLFCNAISTHDVIEHIYDIECFFENLHRLPGSTMSVVMATGTNSLNPRIKRKKMRMHFNAEYMGKIEVWGHKKRDTTKSYLEARREIISNYSPDLSSDEKHHLAKLTRGFIEADIEKVVDRYRKNNVLPEELNHPTNTCDPYTGNWEEHLMNPFHLLKILKETGFYSSILNGYYGKPKNPLKRLLTHSLNITIYMLSSKGMYISPFIVIYGRRNSG